MKLTRIVFAASLVALLAACSHQSSSEQAPAVTAPAPASTATPAPATTATAPAHAGTATPAEAGTAHGG